jgi:hypothetical protein
MLVRAWRRAAGVRCGAAATPRAWVRALALSALRGTPAAIREGMRFDDASRVVQEPPSPRRTARRSAAVALLAAALAAGCTGAEPAPGPVSRPAPPVQQPDAEEEQPPAPATPEPTAPQPAHDVCGPIGDYLDAWGVPSDCDATLAETCADLGGLFSDAYLAAIADCVEDDHSPMTCVVLALGDLEPTAAHLELASRFCDECVLGVPGCEELFYFEEDEPIGLGVIALPFSDEIVLQIAEECTDGLTCAVDLPGCARDVIEASVSTDGLLECVLGAVMP